MYLLQGAALVAVRIHIMSSVAADGHKGCTLHCDVSR